MEQKRLPIIFSFSILSARSETGLPILKSLPPPFHQFPTSAAPIPTPQAQRWSSKILKLGPGSGRIMFRDYFLLLFPKVNFNREMRSSRGIGTSNDRGRTRYRIKFIQEINTYQWNKHGVTRSIRFPKGIQVFVEEKENPRAFGCDHQSIPYH